MKKKNTLHLKIVFYIDLIADIHAYNRPDVVEACNGKWNFMSKYSIIGYWIAVLPVYMQVFVRYKDFSFYTQHTCK